MRLKRALFLPCLAMCIVIPVSAAGQVHVEPPGSRQPIGPAAPRIAPLPEARWDDTHRQLVAKFARDGRPDNGLRTLLHLPVLVEAVVPYTNYLEERSTLQPRHRHLLILRTAWVSGSQALWSSAAARARAGGLSDAEIRRVAEGAGAKGWSSVEETLLRMTDQLYRISSVRDETWKALAAAYDLLGQVDAVETVNHFTTLALLYNSLGVQPDEGATERLPRDVPYRLFAGEREPALTVARIAPVEGAGIAVGRTFGRHPRLNEVRGGRANFINRVSKLTPRHREMLILRTGWNTQSEYEWAQHVGSVGRAREHGLDPVRIAEGPTAPGWDPFEMAILQAADDLYRDTVVSDRVWRLLAERFDTGLLMSAVFTASSYRATAMALNAFGVQLEPGDERFPQIPSRPAAVAPRPGSRE
jgi:4-carboxymuconolactone decarboxylase